MNVAVFSTKPYDKRFLTELNAQGHAFSFFDPHLDATTAPLAAKHDAVCIFVNDRADAEALRILAQGGVKAVALRCAGFNNVDLAAAAALGIQVANVPSYSPHAVAEHTVGLILALNRRIHRAYARVREGNFSLEGLMGFDIFGRTAGIIGMGRIGKVVAQILKGFGCRVLAFDDFAQDFGDAERTTLDELLRQSDIISLHCPLTPDTHHIVNQDTLIKMKEGVMLINTSRGALIDTQAVIMALKTGMVGYLGLDVYEQESDLFFEDLSDQVIHDDVFERLITFPNVIITGHQAFFTENALRKIAETTLSNISEMQAGGSCANLLGKDRVKTTPRP